MSEDLLSSGTKGQKTASMNQRKGITYEFRAPPSLVPVSFQLRPDANSLLTGPIAEPMPLLNSRDLKRLRGLIRGTLQLPTERTAQQGYSRNNLILS